MALPYTYRETVWSDKAASETKELDEAVSKCATVIVEVITTGFSGTLNIQGKQSEAASFDNIRYVPLSAVAYIPSIAQLSYSTDTSRKRYAVPEYWYRLQLAMARTAGSITVNAVGIDVPLALPIGTILKTVSVTKALAAAAAYDAEDVLSESATAGTVWTFADIARAVGTSGYITKVHVLSETTAITPRLVLYLFTATPTCVLNDHAANTALVWADLANYVGKVDLPAMEDLGTGKSEAVATPSTYGSLPLAFTCASAADDLIGVLVTRDAFTQAVGDDMVVRVTVEQY